MQIHQVTGRFGTCVCKRWCWWRDET